MTISRKRCICGQYKVPLANGTMPRHTVPYLTQGGMIRIHCHGTGTFPPVTVKQRIADNRAGDRIIHRHVQVPVIERSHDGPRRASRVGTKLRYKRNRAGGYNN